MTFTESLLIIFGDAAIKATLLLGAAALIAALLRRAPAAARHLVWSLGLAGALCLPLLTQTVPRLDLALPHFHQSQTQTSAPPPSAGGGLMTPGAGNVPEFVTAPRVSAKAPTPSCWPVCALVVWLAGVGLTLTRLFCGVASVRKIARASGPIERGPLADWAAAACRALAVRGPVDFRRASASGHVPVPVGWGWLRPTVVLPAGAADWPAERVDAALLHELAHIKRQDWPVQMLTEIVCALYWFHPLVWLAARQSRRESEYACDDLVLGAGMAPTDYAGHLLSVVRSARAFSAAPVTAVTMGPTRPR